MSEYPSILPSSQSLGPRTLERLLVPMQEHKLASDRAVQGAVRRERQQDPMSQTDLCNDADGTMQCFV